MQKKSLKEVFIMGFFLSIAIASIMSAFAPLLSGAPLTFESWLPSAMVGFLVSFLISPAIYLGDMFADFAGAKPHSPANFVLSTFMMTVIMTVVMSFVMTGYATGFGDSHGISFMTRWLEPLPSFFAIAFIVSLVFVPVGVTIMKKILRVPKMPSEQA